jgi:glutamyl-tRNA synthetase
VSDPAGTLDRTLVDSLFASELPRPEHWEELYPERELPPGAYVTRFGPSPTGFVHIGGLYTAMISRDLAKSTDGVYFVRIEDTDRVREVVGAREQFDRTFRYLGLEPDEGEGTGLYGPYEQSQRGQIYETYVRELMRSGQAYPCFCSHADLQELSNLQRAAGAPPGYYGEWARCRGLSEREVAERVARGAPYAVRFRSPGAIGSRVSFTDLVRGEVEMDDNRNDAVILKSSLNEPRLPTYHFAHVVDDHLMRVNLVVRAEEWLSSVPLHLQLFAAAGFEQVPYAHVAPLMKLEGSSRRKLSKRKDPEASSDFYLGNGYPAAAIIHYLRGLANSRLADLDFEEARRSPLRLEELGVAGPLVDLVKLESISRDWIATLPAAAVYEQVLAWADEYDAELAALLRAEADRAARALAVERDGAEKPRKDLAKWADFRPVYAFFLPELFELVDSPADPRFGGLDPELVRTLAAGFAAGYVHDLDGEAWFGQIRELAERHGFAPGMREFRQDPDRYAGTIREVSMVLRVAVTGATRSPDLYEVSRVLGADEVLRRVRAVAGQS